MKYKGYTAVLKLDEEQGILFGRVIGLCDVITFQAESVPQAIEEFHASVDSYLELCRSRQESPEKPYSGNFMVRVDPELHRQIATWWQAKSVSINSLVASLIRHACESGEEMEAKGIMAADAMKAKDIMTSRDELKDLVASENCNHRRRLRQRSCDPSPSPRHGDRCQQLGGEGASRGQAASLKIEREFRFSRTGGDPGPPTGRSGRLFPGDSWSFRTGERQLVDESCPFWIGWSGVRAAWRG